MNLDAYDNYLQMKRSVQDKLVECGGTPVSKEVENQLKLIESRLQDKVDYAINNQREHLISLNLVMHAETIKAEA